MEVTVQKQRGGRGGLVVDLPVFPDATPVVGHRLGEEWPHGCQRRSSPKPDR
jgi:hypothetical protein